MRGRPPRHVADISLQLLHEQRVVPFQFNGWHGLLVQDFPVFSPEREEILYEVSSREIALIPIEEHGTLLVSLTRGYDPSHGPLPDLTAQAVLFTRPLHRGCCTATCTTACRAGQVGVRSSSQPSSIAPSWRSWSTRAKERSTARVSPAFRLTTRGATSSCCRRRHQKGCLLAPCTTTGLGPSPASSSSTHSSLHCPTTAALPHHSYLK